MNLDEIQQYLYEQIPLSIAMKLEVRAFSKNGVKLFAPLEPNINHRGTAFGGSLSSLAILSVWTLVHFRLLEEGLESRLVIHKNEMEFLKPVERGFWAKCELESENEWETFKQILLRKGKSRLEAQATIESEGEVQARLGGEFVAIR